MKSWTDRDMVVLEKLGDIKANKHNRTKEEEQKYRQKILDLYK